MAQNFSDDTYFLPEDGFEVVGDTEVLGGADRGGSDEFYGDDDGYGYTAYGDAYAMEGRSRGGNDFFVGGDNVNGGSGNDSIAGALGNDSLGALDLIDGGVDFAGDAAEMFGQSMGGNDTMVGGENSMNEFAGDASGSMYGRARGGNDVIVGGGSYGSDGYESTNILIGDGYDMYGQSRGGQDTIVGGEVYANDGYAAGIMLAVGDGYSLNENAIGASDYIEGADAYSDSGDAYAINVLAGDAAYMSGLAKSGNDTMVGGDAYGDGYGEAFTVNLMAGDALDAESGGKFGNDMMTGGSGGGDGYVLNYMFGDAGATLFGGPGPNALGELGLGAFGDISALSEVNVSAIYGNDTLIGGAWQAQNYLVGDAQTLDYGDKGGNDRLVAGDGYDITNYMVGDAVYMYEGSKGGNDTLVSGNSADWMWGDAQEGNDGIGGKDVFVFGAENGNDIVYDFVVGQDKLRLEAWGPGKYAFHVLSTTGRMEDTGEGVLLHLGLEPWDTDNTVLLVGVTADSLTSGSFL